MATSHPDRLAVGGGRDPNFRPRLHHELLQRYSPLLAPTAQAGLAAKLASEVACCPQRTPQLLLESLLWAIIRGQSCCGLCAPALVADTPEGVARLPANEAAALHLVAAASRLLQAEQLPLAATALSVITIPQHPAMLRSTADLLLTLIDEIQAGLQRPGLIGAADAAAGRSGIALRIGNSLTGIGLQAGRDTSLVTLLTAPAAVGFVTDSSNFLQRGDLIIRSSQVSAVRQAAALLGQALQRPPSGPQASQQAVPPDVGALSVAVTAAPLHQRAALLESAVRMAAWLAIMPPQLLYGTVKPGGTFPWQRPCGESVQLTANTVWRKWLTEPVNVIAASMEDDQQSLQQRTADMLLGTLTVLLLRQTSALCDAMPVESMCWKRILRVAGEIRRAASAAAVQSFCIAVRCAACATVAACHSSVAAVQTAAVGAMPAVALAAAVMRCAGPADSRDVAAFEHAVPLLLSVSRTCRMLLASGQQSVLSASGSALDGELLPGTGPEGGYPACRNGLERLVHAHLDALYGLSGCYSTIASTLLTGGVADLAALEHFSEPDGPANELSSVVSCWPTEGPLAVFRRMAPAVEADRYLDDLIKFACGALAGMAMQLVLAINSGRQPRDAAIEAAGAAATASMSLFSRSVERKHQVPDACARNGASSAVLLTFAALRLPATGCRALLRCGFGAALSAMLAALLAAPRSLVRPVERALRVFDLPLGCMLGLRALITKARAGGSGGGGGGGTGCEWEQLRQRLQPLLATSSLRPVLRDEAVQLSAALTAAAAAQHPGLLPAEPPGSQQPIAHDAAGAAAAMLQGAVQPSSSKAGQGSKRTGKPRKRSGRKHAAQRAAPTAANPPVCQAAAGAVGVGDRQAATTKKGASCAAPTGAHTLQGIGPEAAEFAPPQQPEDSTPPARRSNALPAQAAAPHAPAMQTAQAEESQPSQPEATQPDDWMICPLTQETMTDPVVLSDGCSYERSAITRWLATRSTSPVTGQPLSSTKLVPNRALKSLVEAVAHVRQMMHSDVQGRRR